MGTVVRGLMRWGRGGPMHEMIFRAKRAHVRAYQLARSLCAPFELTPARFDILFVIRAFGGQCGQTDIVQQLGLSRTTISLGVKRLIELGFVQKVVAAGASARSVLVALTSQGLDRIVAAVKAFIRRDDLRDYFDHLDSRGGKFVEDCVRYADRHARHLGDLSQLAYRTTTPTADEIADADADNAALRMQLVAREQTDPAGPAKAPDDDGACAEAGLPDSSGLPLEKAVARSIEIIASHGPSQAQLMTRIDAVATRLNSTSPEVGKLIARMGFESAGSDVPPDLLHVPSVMSASERDYAKTARAATGDRLRERRRADEAWRVQSTEPEPGPEEALTLEELEKIVQWPSDQELARRVEVTAEENHYSSSQVGALTARLASESTGSELPQSLVGVPSVLTRAERAFARRSLEAIHARAAARDAWLTEADGEAAVDECAVPTNSEGVAWPPSEELDRRLDKLASMLAYTSPQFGRLRARLRTEELGHDVPEGLRDVPSVLTRAERALARRRASEAACEERARVEAAKASAPEEDESWR